MLLRKSLATFLVPAVVVGALAASGAGCFGNDDFTICEGCPGGCVHDEHGDHCLQESTGTRTAAGGFGGMSATGDGGAGGAGTGGTANGGSGGAGGKAPTCDPAVETCPCDASGACDGGLDCVGGLCIDGCEFTYQCGANRTCVDGGCVASCTTPGDCATGYTCTGGLCVVDTANPQCSSSMPCDGVNLSCEDGICRDRCTTTAGCGAGKVCDFSTGTCIDDPSATRACSDMMPCTGTGQDCGVDGFCHYPCATAADCQLVNVFYTDCKMGICMTHDEAHPECDIANPCQAPKHCVSNHCQ